MTGLPEGKGLVRFPGPKRIVELSADGLHLQALSEAGVLYRGDNLTSKSHVEGWFNWTDRWGWPLGNGPGLRPEWPMGQTWSVSDSHPFGVDHYEDPNGTTHSVGLGVGHLYRLGPEGRRIHFNDWWLPADWSRQICGPRRGTLRAVGLSASASTIFLVGERGALYTRLYDFDTAGENDLLTYSYLIEGDHGTTRKLPAEPWRRQPRPPGRISRRITIFQTGEGNAARTLRVEGRQGERTGYFEKAIFADEWRFVETGAPLSGPLLPDPEDAGEESAAQPLALRYAGTIGRTGRALRMEVEGFHPFCSPARARLVHDGRPLAVDGEVVWLELHHVHRLVEEIRPALYWDEGQPAEIRTALLLPKALWRVDDAEAKALVAELFGKRRVVNSQGTASQRAMDLEEIPWSTPFRVPAKEKPLTGALTTRLETVDAPGR